MVFLQINSTLLIPSVARCSFHVRLWQHVSRTYTRESRFHHFLLSELLIALENGDVEDFTTKKHESKRQTHLPTKLKTVNKNAIMR